MHSGLIVPELLEDGRVKVDMGKPILNASDVPTTLPGNDDGTAVAVPLEVAGSSWTITAVGMGNPHAVVYSKDGEDVKARLLCLFVPAQKPQHTRGLMTQTHSVL